MTITIKKYGNRRLYDTSLRRYVTLHDVTEQIRAGAQVQVVDARSGGDITRATLTQIIMEGRGADLLPAPLLHQLIRLQDDVLADFLGRYVQTALDLYLQARRSTQALLPFNPLAGLAPFWMPAPGVAVDPTRAAEGPVEPEPDVPPEPDATPPTRQELEALRRDVEALRRQLESRSKADDATR